MKLDMPMTMVGLPTPLLKCVDTWSTVRMLAIGATASERHHFRMMLDVVGDRPEIVARIDIFDADTQEVVAERDVLRSDFQEPFTYVDITLEFDLNSRRGHAMETRVW